MFSSQSSFSDVEERGVYFIPENHCALGYLQIIVKVVFACHVCLMNFTTSVLCITSVTSEDGQTQHTTYRGLSSPKYVTCADKLGPEWVFCAEHATNAKIFQIT